jgi:hypothetical protein
MNEEAHWCASLVQLPGDLPGLLSNLCMIGVGGATGEMDTPRAEFDEKEPIQRLKVKCFNGEKSHASGKFVSAFYLRAFSLEVIDWSNP